MDRSKINYAVDVGLAITFVLSALTGVLKFPGLLPFFGASYRSLPMAKLSTIHDWSGVIMALLVLTHIIFHWRWIVCFTKSLFSKGAKR